MRLVDIDLLPRVIIGAGGEFMQGVQYMREMLNLLPTVEVPEVRHGELVNIADYGLGKCFGSCSLCGMTMQADHPSALKLIYGYCPNCGAKMEVGSDGQAT